MNSKISKILALVAAMVLTVCVYAFADANDVMLISEAPDAVSSDADIASDAEVASDAEAASDAEVTSDAEIDSAADVEVDSDADVEVDSAADAEVDSDADVEVDSAADAEADSAADTVKTFTDLDPNDWAYDAIVALAEKGIVSGDETGAINPDGGVTREEIAKMMVVARGYEVNSDAALDIADPETVADWAKGYVATAIEKGIISGYTDGTVRGNSVVNRAEMATIIVRSLNASTDNFDQTSFVDVTTDDWYAKYVECAKTLGIVNGYEDGTFKGEAQVTRREAFAMVERLVNLLEALEA